MFAALRLAGFQLGIISNSQFYTPLLFPALVDQSLETLGCDPKLSFLSFEHRHAKPGAYLYELARNALEPYGIAATQTLFVGNDMRNDVAPAAGVGFRTALFAGDQRSLRLRLEDADVARITPDIVVTQLNQIPPCVV